MHNILEIRFDFRIHIENDIEDFDCRDVIVASICVQNERRKKKQQRTVISD